MSTLVRILLNQFGGFTKSSAKLFSRNRQTSKDIFRTSILYVSPPCSKGDVIRTEDKLFLVTTLMPNRIKGTSLLNCKPVHINFNTDSKIEVLPIVEMEITQTYPEVYAINPNSFEVQKVECCLKKPANKAKGVISKNKIYLID